MKIGLLILVTFFSAFANAGTQTVLAVQGGELTINGKQIIAQGIVTGKRKSGPVYRLQVQGTLGGKVCGPYTCVGALSVNSKSEVILTAGLDADQDGNFEAREQFAVGSLNGGQIQFVVPVTYAYVIQKYNFIEHLNGLKDSEYFAVGIDLR